VPVRGTSVTELRVSRFDVDSVDGVSIAVWVEGRGPALVTIHGSIADHTTFEPFVDAVAARTGEPVALWGHSYGANCAMGGATLTANVGHLVLYEPSLGLPYPPGSIDRIEAALAEGDREAAIVAVLRTSTPNWRSQILGSTASSSLMRRSLADSRAHPSSATDEAPQPPSRYRADAGNLDGRWGRERVVARREGGA
jgi:hypothetical protein